MRNSSMMLWIIAAVGGIIIALFLVFKYTKTGKNDVIGFGMKCKTCGETTNGLKCSRCSNKKNDWR
tara:strand:- start:2802 stop:2999 length:198 start_codon:yes stop_codon:yes gene_type:complete